MARSLKKIQEDIDATKGKYARKPQGMVRRKDILDVLNYHKDPDKERENVAKFLETIDSEILTYEKKQKILNDLDSYHVSYKRE